MATPGDRRADKRPSFAAYGELFEGDWPTKRVDEDWLAERFGMALMCGSNYLHLRCMIRPDDPLALLHIRYLADERIGSGWSDKGEQQPKTWATALGVLTLHRWASDLMLARASASLRRLPTRPELLVRLQSETQSGGPTSPEARALLRKLAELRPGLGHATSYQRWVRDVFLFLFGEVLKEPKIESRTYSGTQRRDITFRNAAEKGPWFDWKIQYHVDPLLIECKNKDSLTHDDLRQAASYLGNRMGQLGIVACRKSGGDALREMLNYILHNDEKYLLVVSDDDLAQWVRLKGRGEDPTAAIADVYRSLREGAQ